MSEAKNYLGKKVELVIDRPKGSKHPKHGFTYEVNYGYVPGTKSADGAELDGYYLGEEKPVDMAEGLCVAVIVRKEDDDPKLVVVKEGEELTDEDIREKVKFQEKFFEFEIIR